MSTQHQTTQSHGMSAGNVDLWFGDSWPIGTELGSSTDSIDLSIYPNAKLGIDNPMLAFSQHVSDHRQNKLINFARGGSSLDFALYSLLSFCKSKFDPKINYTAFLCLSEQARGYGISNLLKKHFHFSRGNPKSKFDLYVHDSMVALNSFCLICKNFGIDLKIIPVFSNFEFPEQFDNINFIEDHNWVCKESITYLTFNEHMCNDKGEVDFNKHWIVPNEMHANAYGHKMIANKIISLLT